LHRFAPFMSEVRVRPTSLVCLPTELLSAILEHCDGFADLRSLITTCRRFYDVFESQKGHILRAVGLRALFAFDVALIAVRATKLACDALASNRLPPLNLIYPLQNLAKPVPTIHEFQEILKLQHLGRCVEHLMLMNAARYPNRQFEPGITLLQYAVGWPRNDPLFPLLHHLWKERLYRNIFRLMVCGASLAAAYHEPFFYNGPEKPPNFLYDYVGSLNRRHQYFQPSTFPDPKSRDPWISNAELEFLEQFPVYRIAGQDAPLDGEEMVQFTPLADWLAEDMRQAANREGDTFFWYGEQMGRWPITMQVLQCLWTSEQLNTLLAAPVGDRGYERLPIPSLIEKRRNAMALPGMETAQTMSVNVILHGVYQPEEITMPVRPGDEIVAGVFATRRNLLSKTSARQLGKPMSLRCPGFRRPKQVKLNQLLRRVTYALPLHISMWETALPEHRLFGYVLQGHCGLKQGAARSLIWATSAYWGRIVSVLAFRHMLEEGFSEVVKQRLPHDYTGHQSQAWMQNWETFEEESEESEHASKE